MRAVTVDRTTLYCVGASTDPGAVACALRDEGVRVRPVDPGTALEHRMVALAAHDLTAAELAETASATTDCWVHLVSSGPNYPHVPTLARDNLVTRSARAYAPSLSEYVIGQHVLHCAATTPGETPKPFHRRDALVVGYGAFGHIIAQTLTALGARVTVVRPRSRTAHPFGGAQAVPVEHLPNRLAHLMIVALPGLPELTGFLDDALFRRLRLDGHLINPARSDPVDRDALLRWLAAGTGSLTSDVESDDDAEALRPWIDKGRVTLTPHIAWRPWDGDPLYHRDWAAIFATAAVDRPTMRGQSVRLDPAAIAADYLIP
ncbi:D-isomer specific 2-hydroxyacid dehydrogenase-like protein [Nocardia tenerifensis]|uniref:D-isomer specific 2-hydroxyacid dehydrogenase-like protein n=1 Tax=Nocardia tenerifensis TaxID=228006 RepID=A0A318KZF6_9NOCA|nr:NAD(P)-dependent oxidoreductase [Nocardia tenerifensis]PXX71244.1 D-isomer specific 2-hydroxyacid dehydrogenase-like protein [Nocardia tenerifensis]